MLRRSSRAPVTVEGDDIADPEQSTFRGAGGGIPEERSIERVQAGTGDPDPTEAEREHGVVGVARVVRRRAVRRQDREVRLAAERLVERDELRPRSCVAAPRVLEPAGADLGVRTAVDPALVTVHLASRSPLPQVAVVTQREATRRVVERLRVGHLERGETGWAAEVHQRRGGLLTTDPRG